MGGEEELRAALRMGVVSTSLNLGQCTYMAACVMLFKKPAARNLEAMAALSLAIWSVERAAKASLTIRRVVRFCWSRHDIAVEVLV